MNTATPFASSCYWNPRLCRVQPQRSKDPPESRGAPSRARPPSLALALGEREAPQARDWHGRPDRRGESDQGGTMASEELPPDTLERARLQRAGLRQAIVNVEVALATPAVSGRAPVWVTDVGAALYRLRGALEHHIEVTENPDGILAQIVQLAPRLAGPCDRLRQ